MQGARCDAVRALLAAGNAAERRLWKSEITIIYWGLLRGELESTRRNYLKIENYKIPQHTLDNKILIQAMKIWQEKKPNLFFKRIYN